MISLIHAFSALLNAFLLVVVPQCLLISCGAVIANHETVTQLEMRTLVLLALLDATHHPRELTVGLAQYEFGMQRTLHIGTCGVQLGVSDGVPACLAVPEQVYSDGALHEIRGTQG